MHNMKIKKLVLSGLFAAIICVTTIFPHLPVGVNGGYVHIGDTFIYLAASFLSPAYAVAASMVGAGLADLMVAPMYIIPTLIIKSLMALMFTSKGNKLLCKRNVLATIFAGIICTVGYYTAEVILAGNFISPLISTLQGLIQPVVSGIIYAVIASVIDKKRGILS